MSVKTTFKNEVSEEAIDILKGILERDPRKRLTYKQILDHPWMSDVVPHMNLFTELEKDKIVAEYDYYSMNKATKGGEVVQADPFAE